MPGLSSGLEVAQAFLIEDALVDDLLLSCDGRIVVVIVAVVAA